MTNTKKRPEVLVPAGTLEKLKVAVNYGADAVFVGGQAYGLRSRAGNFTMDELREGIEYAHARGVDVHVASNMVTHEGNEQGAGEWFRELRDMGLDAVIVSDPALIEICATYAPGLNIHLSTHSSMNESFDLKIGTLTDLCQLFHGYLTGQDDTGQAIFFPEMEGLHVGCRSLCRQVNIESRCIGCTDFNQGRV